MLLGKKTLFSFMLGLELLANILEITHFNDFYVSTLVSFCVYMLLPGFLISLILRIKKISFWENLLFIVGFSIAFLELGGLCLNTLLPFLGVKDPLAFGNLMIGFTIFMCLLFLMAWLQTRNFSVRLHLPRRTSLEKSLYALPVCFPVFAALGAIILNNGGGDIVTLILLGGIACYSLLLVALHKKIAVDLYAYALFFMAVACLFTTSLRSWFITGHDIEREFFVFQLTNTQHLWSMASYQDAYNACLSITILPTIITNLLSVPDMYVYKVIFQILFAISPVLVFFIISNYIEPVFAFLSAFFFISFPTFFNDMPMLNRQEIGFIFFGLMLYVMLWRDQAPQASLTWTGLPHPQLSLLMRRILFVLFAIGVIISHYSTNFVALALVTFVYVGTFIISPRFMKKFLASLLLKSPIKLQSTFTNNALLNLPLILMLFCATYVWNNFYTQSSSHTGSVISGVVSSILVKSNADKQSSDLSYSILPTHPLDPKQQLQEYIQSLIDQARSVNTGKVNNSQFYDPSIIRKYPIYPVPSERLAPTPLGRWLSAFNIPVFDIQAALRALSADFMQVFVFIGLLCIFFLKRRSFDLQYMLLCFGSIFLLALITVLPDLSVEYGVLRMFEQLLFMLSLPIVIGLSSVLFFAKEQKRILFTGIVAIIFFLNLTGFISHLTGDYYPQMTLDNAGLYYDAYYVHKTDVVAIVWLSENNETNEPVQSDLSGTNKLLTYGHIYALIEIFPPIIRKNAYVFLEVPINTVVSIDKNVLVYNSSKPFLDDTKNLIYSNGADNIYK